MPSNTSSNKAVVPEAKGALDRFKYEVADYVHSTGNPCMYRVTPFFKGDELVARGVEMEAESVKDQKISFHVFVYNIQPGIEIDYTTGNSWEE